MGRHALAGVEKMQCALTEQREKHRFLVVRVRALPRSDMHRAAWVNIDKFSTVWVSAWPAKDCYLSNPELAEIASTYFGLPSPACESFVGQRIADTRMTVDRHGAAALHCNSSR